MSTVIIFAVAAAPAAVQQPLEPLNDPDAYAVYATALPSLWATVSKDVLLLQQETQPPSKSELCASQRTTDPDWAATEESFSKQNEHIKLLQPALPITIPYRFVSHDEIVADDARVALKYPGAWQGRPEYMEYAAVSAVGFNPTRTNAIVSVRTRMHGWTGSYELLDGQWQPAKHRGSCTWSA